MKFRPCIDIHQGRVKQIVGSSLKSKVKTNFETKDSAVYFGKIFANAHLWGGHVCLLDTSSETRSQAMDLLGSFPGKWQIGGGINTNTAQEFLDAGAEKVIITTALFEGNNIFQTAQNLAQNIGKENLVLDLSCQCTDGSYWLMKDNWMTLTNFLISIENLHKLTEYCSEFLVHGVSVEGKKAGFDQDLVSILSDFVEQKTFPITYGGGIASQSDIRNFREISNANLDFTIGSALAVYGGTMEIEDILSSDPFLKC